MFVVSVQMLFMHVCAHEHIFVYLYLCYPSLHPPPLQLLVY